MQNSQDDGRVAVGEQAFVNQAATHLAPTGFDPSRVPFMPVVDVTDDMLINIGGKVITWGELRRLRDSDGSGEADKTGTGLAVGDSAGLKGIAQPLDGDPQ